MRPLSSIALLTVLAAAPPGWAQDADPAEPAEAAAQTDPQATLQTFQQQLTPYGAWETDPTYGQVFYPGVSPGWRPYQYGRWEMTASGWTWVSDEPFGWATFHYGRWWWNKYRQAWAWVPGYEWAPAWVVWRYGAGAVGWAPLYVGYDSWTESYPVIYNQWVYVAPEHFYDGPVVQFMLPPERVRVIYYSGTPVRGSIGGDAYGPPQQFIQLHSPRHIERIPITSASSASAAMASHGHPGESIAMFRPVSTAGQHPATPAEHPGLAETPRPGRAESTHQPEPGSIAPRPGPANPSSRSTPKPKLASRPTPPPAPKRTEPASHPAPKRK